MEKDNLLDDFSWDTTEEIINEGINQESQEDDVEESPLQDSEESVENKKSKKEVTDLDDEFFGEEDDIEESSEDNTEESPTSIYMDHTRDLIDRGIFRNIEIGEDEDIDADRFFELQEQEIETEISNRLKAWAEDELDDDAKAFIKFKREGGSTKDFFKVYSTSPEDILEGDIEDPKFQEKIIRKQLQDEDWDEEEIEDRLESLSDSGRMERVAKKYFNKMQDEAEEEKRELLRQTEERQALAKRNEEEFKNTLKETLNSTEELNGFKITTKDRSNLFNFLTKKDYTSGNRSLTGFQKKMAEVFQDKDKLVLLSKILYNDFDFSSLEKKTETKKVKEIKSRLEQRKGPKSFNSGSSLKGRSLADLFE